MKNKFLGLVVLVVSISSCKLKYGSRMVRTTKLETVENISSELKSNKHAIVSTPPSKKVGMSYEGNPTINNYIFGISPTGLEKYNITSIHGCTTKKLLNKNNRARTPLDTAKEDPLLVFIKGEYARANRLVKNPARNRVVYFFGLITLIKSARTRRRDLKLALEIYNKYSNPGVIDYKKEAKSSLIFNTIWLASLTLVAALSLLFLLVIILVAVAFSI
jgi:hypothetical protein